MGMTWEKELIDSYFAIRREVTMMGCDVYDRESLIDNPQALATLAVGNLMRRSLFKGVIEISSSIDGLA